VSLYWCYSEYHNADHHIAEYQNAECHCNEYCYAEFRYDDKYVLIQGGELTNFFLTFYERGALTPNGLLCF
jgi:hypothetical protein